MVSTRGPRYRFGEGERVLCYEPDPTKAKVLYDSKVLEVIESKDKRGRRTVEYLIHFQGWNSSWDRCVSEDFVLKDTEENRQLQRDLAEKSQLQLGAYLYRRERKKGSGSTSGSGATSSGGVTSNGPGPAKRARHSGNFDDDGSSSSTQNDEGDTDSSSGGSGSGASQAAAPPPPVAQGRAHITLPSALRDRLTFDYHLVVKRGRLSALPASPCVAEILESFVRWFARAGAWNEQGSRNPRSRRALPSSAQRPDLQDVARRLNLVREVADGLRIYFDYLLRGHLLYKQELNQYHEIVGQFMEGYDLPYVKSEPQDPDNRPTSSRNAREQVIKTELAEDSNETTAIKEEPMEPAEEESVDQVEQQESREEEAERQEENIIMSPKMQEYSHLPPDPEDLPPSVQSAPLEEPTDTAPMKSEPETPAPEETPATSASRTRDSRSKDSVKPDSVARRLRSHKNSVTSQPDTPEEPMPSTSQAPDQAQRATDAPSAARSSASSERRDSESSLGEGWWCRRPSAQLLDLPAARTALPALLEKVAKWHVIPREGTEQMPCRVYGAVHLSRLFVKLPDFLNAIHMPDAKLKMLLKHIDMFVQYLDEHSEWFGETYYIADSMSRSH